MRICYSCMNLCAHLDEVSLTCEKCDTNTKNQKKTNSYLSPNPNIRNLYQTNLKTIKSIPILKNGSRAEELKSCTIKKIGKILISNTCTFDTIASIYMVAYCDSQIYSDKIDGILEAFDFFSFISKTVKCGITMTTYSERAELILKFLHPNIEIINNAHQAVCNSTSGYIFDRLFWSVPSIVEKLTCQGLYCDKIIHNHQTFLTYYTKGDLSELQDYIGSMLRTEKNNFDYINGEDTCQGTETISAELSNLHIIVDILGWKDANNSYTTEAIPPINLQLKEIPETIVFTGTTFVLRGVGCYQSCPSRLINSVGHYYAVCKRGPSNWEKFDDSKKHTNFLSATTIVPCDFLIYTV